MDPLTIGLIALLTALAAALYASVGHGGASAYLAIMALFALPVEVMRPTALTLNLLVAGWATVVYVRSGQFNPRLFLAFVVTAAPMAWLGGRLDPPEEIYRPLVGLVLWAAAARLLWRPDRTAARPVRPPRLAVTLPAGAGLGLLAGLTGTGGGVFLSPLVVLLGWETARRVSGVAAAFILVNSAAGLAGAAPRLADLPPALPLFAAAVVAGGAVGAWLGADRVPRAGLLVLLGLVLLLAGAKLIFT